MVIGDGFGNEENPRMVTDTNYNPGDTHTLSTLDGSPNAAGSSASSVNISVEEPISDKPVKRSRRRKQVSCSFCRHRKLKCDRNQPCSNCTKRGVALSCTYRDKKSDEDIEEDATNAEGDIQPAIYKIRTRGMGATTLRASTLSNLTSSFESMQRDQAGPKSNLNPDDVRQRLDKMESLVLAILTDRELNASQFHEVDQDGEEAIDRLGDSLGLIKLDKKGKSIYHGDTHWSTLFNGFDEVQGFFDNLRKTYEAAHLDINNLRPCIGDATRAQSRFSASPFSTQPRQAHMSGDEILSLVPKKEICDLLIQRYFDIFQPVIPVVHRPTFDQSYRRFWHEPQQSELVWIALLFCILSLGLQSYHPSELPDPYKDLDVATLTWKSWLNAVETCGYVSRITIKPSLLNIRVLILWMFVQAGDVPTKDWAEIAWISMGGIVKIAQAMGMHRDPKWFAMSQFEVEERKRLWSIIQFLDSYCSLVQGLPLSIHSSETDGADPANIDEINITPSSNAQFTVPESDLRIHTSTTFLIYRHRITKFLRRALEMNFNVEQKIDGNLYYKRAKGLLDELLATYNEIPILWRKPASESLLKDPPELVAQRFMLEMEYLKTVVVIYRKFSSFNMIDTRYNHCREKLVQASILILQRHIWVFDDPQARTILHRYWWLITVMSVSHVIHAIMFLALTLLNHYDRIEAHQRAVQLQVIERAGSIMNFIQFSPMYDMPQTLLIKVLVNQVLGLQNISQAERQAKMFKTKSAEQQKKGVTMELVGEEDVNVDGMNECARQSNSPENSTNNMNTTASSVDGSGSSTSAFTPSDMFVENDNSNINFNDFNSVPSFGGNGMLQSEDGGMSMNINASNMFADEGIFRNTFPELMDPDEWDNLLQSFKQGDGENGQAIPGMFTE